MTKRQLLALALVSFVACGGGSKSADTAPTGEELEATPVATEAETETATAAVAETEGGADCGVFCRRMLACALKLSVTETTTEEQKSEFLEMCDGQCAEEDSEKIAAARACAADNTDSCAGFMECVRLLQEQ